MKKIILIFAVCFSLLYNNVLLGQESYFYIGYCDGAIASTTPKVGTATGRTGSNSDIENAIKFEVGQLDSYTGCELHAIRVGLPDSNVLPDSLFVWVRESLTGTNLATGYILSPQPGWNEVHLDSPYCIKANQDLCLGYGYHQASTKYIAISYVGNTHPDACYSAKNGSWTDYSSKGFGSLSVEGVLTGDYLPQRDLALSYCSLVTNNVQIGDTIRVIGTVRNNASESVSSLCFRYQIGDVTGVANIGTSIDYRDEKTFEFGIPTQDIENEQIDTLHISLLWADGTEDERMTDNYAQLPVLLYKKAFQRKVFLEEFTAEGCGYCPGGAAILHQVIADHDLHNKVIWMCRHCAYGTDWLTIDADTAQYMKLFGPVNPFAPSMMVDRTFLEGLCTKEDCLPSSIGYNNALRMINYQLSEPAFVQCDITAECKDSILTITVEGEKLDIMDKVCKNPLLTIYIKENEIPSISQHDYNATSDTLFIHQNVSRAVLSDPWGDAILWEGNHFTATYTYKIRDRYVKCGEKLVHDAWNINHLDVVATVSEYDANFILKRRIFNTQEVNVVENDGVSSHLESESLGNAVSYVMYISPEGRTLVEEPSQGFYLKCEILQDGTKRTSKVSRH